MSDYRLRFIKSESIRAISNAIADSTKISRADISSETGLSLVTVGKIVDTLVYSGIVNEIKEVKQQAGRRAGVLSINEDKFILIIDLTSYAFKASILNLRLRPLYEYLFEYKTDTFFADNLNYFLETLNLYIKGKFAIDDCLGIGVTFNGYYCDESDVATSKKIPELATVSLNKIISEYFPSTDILIDTIAHSAAIYNVAYLNNPEHKNIIYWHVSHVNVSGTFLFERMYVGGFNNLMCDFGSLIMSDGLPLEDKIKMAKNVDSCADIIAPYIYNVIKILGPHCVIMDFDLPYQTESILPLIRDILEKKYRLKNCEMPEFLDAFKFVNSAYRGLALILRDRWNERIFFNN